MKAYKFQVIEGGNQGDNIPHAKLRVVDNTTTTVDDNSLAIKIARMRSSSARIAELMMELNRLK
jgi:hypothetical protein